MRYSHLVHTPENLSEQIARIQTNPDALVVGSLGRSVVYQQLVGDPDYEYLRRGEAPLHAGHAPRDIDIIGAEMPAEAAEGPFKIDTLCFSNFYVSLSRPTPGGPLLLASQRLGFCEEVDESVVQPVTGTGTLGIEITTVPAQTHRALFGLQGRLRKKDERTRALLDERLADQRSLPVNPRHYEPFDRLRTLNTQDKILWLAGCYRRFVPDQTRERLVPVARRVRGVLGRII
jgi:hypothetical protein